MRKLIIAVCLFLVCVSAWGHLQAQTPPEVKVVMSTDAAGQNEVITADVMVYSDEVMVGADIGITVDECLRIEGRENGHYLPTTGEENGFVPFEELTESSTRLAATVLGQEVVADPTQYFFRVPLRVLCDSGEAEVTITFAQLVKRDLTSYSLADGQITIANGRVIMGPGQPIVATAQVFPTPTEFVVPPPDDNADQSKDDESSPISVIVIAVVIGLVVLLGLVSILVIRRRSLN